MTTETDVAAMPVEDMDPDDIVLALVDSPPPVDPYPLYRRLHEIAPSWPSIIGMRFLSRYDDCYEALRSPVLHMAIADTMAKSDPRYADSAYLQSVEHMLVFTNPPKHTRLRKLVSRAFTTRTVETLRGRIEELVNGHIDRMAEQGTCDLIAGLAGVLPSQVICEMLGVPLDDQPMIERWTDDVAGTVKPVIPDDALKIADGTIVEFHAYLRELVAARRADPRADLLSALVAAEDDSAALDDDELISFCVTLLGAGTETTTNLIGVGTLALLQNPDQLRKLQDDPSLIGPTVEELLRFEPPVQMAFPRVATADTTIGGEEIVENELIAVLLGAANHDPAVFVEPDQLRIDRPQDKPSLAFGSGAHYCIGAALARLEGEIALQRLLIDRFPGLELATTSAPSWRDAFTLRGVDHLAVTLR